MASPLITGMMVVFSITTAAVVIFPLYRLAPSWLEGRLSKKIAFHRDAEAMLGVAIGRAHNDPAQLARLTRQQDYHRRALQSLVPGETRPTATVIDKAA